MGGGRRDVAAAALNNFPALMKSAPEGAKITVGNNDTPSAVVFTPNVFNVGNRIEAAGLTGDLLERLWPELKATGFTWLFELC